MAGFVSLGNDLFIGSFRASEDVKNGRFVVVDYAEGTAKQGAGKYFVQNINEFAVEEGIGDADIVVKAGKFLRLYVPQTGHILVTTEFEGDLAVGDKVSVGAEGAIVAGGEDFVVKELTDCYGEKAVSLLKLGGAAASETP